MKRFFLVLLVLGLMVYETKTDNFVSSIFWLCPVPDLTHQLLFGYDSPSDMEQTYGKDVTAKVGNAWKSETDADTVLEYITAGLIKSLWQPSSFFTYGKWWNQALIGPYYSTWGGSSLYITQPHSPKGGANAAQLRFLGLGIQDAVGPLVPDNFGNSYGMLKELVHNIFVFTYRNASEVTNYTAEIDGNIFYFAVYISAGTILQWLNANGGGALQSYINLHYNVSWKSLTNYDVMKNFVTIIPQSFQSSLFKEQIHISNSDFNAPLSNVSGLEPTTYFKNNKNYTVYFRLNLTTPGMMMDITMHSYLRFCMGGQRTYTYKYRKDGSSDCGDDYGF